MKKSFTLQPYFPENESKDGRKLFAVNTRNRFRKSNSNRPSALALRNILGFAAACNFHKTELQGTLEIVIN